MKLFSFTLLISLYSISSHGINNTDSLSKHGFHIPKNIHECITELDKAFTKKAKEKFKNYNDSDIRSLNIGGVYIVFEWLDFNSRLVLYFKQVKVVDLYDQIYLIYKSYHAHLNNTIFNWEDEVRAIELRNEHRRQVWLRHYGENTKKDSLGGFYIPMDVEDAVNQLMKVLTLKVKDKIKEGDTALTDTLSSRLIKNWRMDVGSRLAVYFQELGITYPVVTGPFIVDNLRRRLNGDTTNFDLELKEKLHSQKIPEENKNENGYYSSELKEFLSTRKITDKDIFLTSESVNQIHKGFKKKQ